MKITGIKVLKRQHHMDRVYIETDLPQASYPYDGTQDLSFDVAKGGGEQYVRRHFPDVKIEILDYDDGRAEPFSV